MLAYPRFIKPLSISLLLLAALLVRLVVAPSNGYMGIEADLIEYKQAMHRALTLGIHEVYTTNMQNDPAMTGEDWQGGYFITNPPARIYSYYPFVWVYRYFSPEGFALWNSELNFFHDLRDQGLKKRIDQSRGFSISLKFPAILADIVISLMIFLILKNHLPWRAALIAAAIYAFTPGTIMDAAHTGSHDAVAMLLVVVSLWSVSRGWLELAAACFVMAALNKPQAAAFLLFMLFVGFRCFPARRVLQAIAVAIATAVLLFLPFILHGTFIITLSALVHDTLGGEPYISLNATNVWWLLSLGKGAEVPDTTLIWDFVTFRTLGLIVFLFSNVYAMHRLSLVPLTISRIFLGASCIAMAYFILNTEIHENHMIYVLPLLLLSLPCSKKIWAIVVVLAVTLSLNFFLLDPFFYPWLNGVAGLDQDAIIMGSVISAGVNVAIFMAMTWLLYLETRVSHEETPVWLRSVYWTRLEIFLKSMVAVVFLIILVTLNPAHAVREYRISVNNPHIQERNHALDAIMHSRHYENTIAKFSREINMSPEQLMAGVKTEIVVEKSVDVERAAGMVVVIRLSVLEKEQNRLERLDPLFIRLQGGLQEDLERYQPKHGY